MPVIGVTGSFGSGKSVVAGMFIRHGARVFDADRTVHVLLRGKGPVVKAVGRVFGAEILNAQGVDRAKLAGLVFDDPVKLKKLMEILHPRVKQEAVKFIASNGRSSLVVLDVPLLIESGWVGLVDLVLVVRARREQQLQRVRQRSGVRRREALDRIRCQMPLREKLQFADRCIDNTGTLAATEKQVEKFIQDLKTGMLNKKKISIKQYPNRREV